MPNTPEPILVARGATRPEPQAAAQNKPQRGREPQGALQVLAKSAARAVGSQLGRDLMRGLLGSLAGVSGRRRRR